MITFKTSWSSDVWHCAWRDISYVGSLRECLECVELTALKYSQTSRLEILFRCQANGYALGGDHTDDTNWSVTHESLMDFECDGGAE